jgi:hypothetical protein
MSTVILNYEDFEKAFPSRLNVKSKEFMNLPDWDPTKE